MSDKQADIGSTLAYSKWERTKKGLKRKNDEGTDFLASYTQMRKLRVPESELSRGKKKLKALAVKLKKLNAALAKRDAARIPVETHLSNALEEHKKRAKK